VETHPFYGVILARIISVLGENPITYSLTLLSTNEENAKHIGNQDQVSNAMDYWNSM
jgi:hypothetical protein